MLAVLARFGSHVGGLDPLLGPMSAAWGQDPNTGLAGIAPKAGLAGMAGLDPNALKPSTYFFKRYAFLFGYLYSYKPSF